MVAHPQNNGLLIKWCVPFYYIKFWECAKISFLGRIWTQFLGLKFISGCKSYINPKTRGYEVSKTTFTFEIWKFGKKVDFGIFGHF